MLPPPAPETRLRAVVVLFRPDPGAIAFVAALADWGYAPVAVVNAARPEDEAMLASLEGADRLYNDDNRGLAEAFNQGIGHALADGASHVLLFDQDSRPAPEMGRQLLHRAQAAAAWTELGCIGPVARDRKHPDSRVTATASIAHGGVAEASVIISSGMLLPRTAIERVGGMWNELFIDQVDHDWCFRARAAGLSVLVATDVVMLHDMGDAGFSLFGRYKPIHRSPVRHFHIVRNTLWLARLSLIPARWRVSEMCKLALRMPAYLLFSSARAATARSLVQAVAAGLRSPPGRTYRASPPTRTTARATSPSGASPP